MSLICTHLGLSGLGLPLVHGPAGVHSGTGVAANAPGQNRVPAPVLLLGRFLLVALCHLSQNKVKTVNVNIPTVTKVRSGNFIATFINHNNLALVGQRIICHSTTLLNQKSLYKSHQHRNVCITAAKVYLHI